MEETVKGERIFRLKWSEASTRSEIFSGDLTDIAQRLDKILQNLRDKRGNGAANDFIEGFVAFCQRFISGYGDIRHMLGTDEYWTFPITTSVSFREGIITSGGVIAYLDEDGKFSTKKAYGELKSAVNQMQMYVSGLISTKEIKNLGI